MIKLAWISYQDLDKKKKHILILKHIENIKNIFKKKKHNVILKKKFVFCQPWLV